ncbi:MAG: YidC/Oxa1 family rane protein insertase, partial [Sphingomonadales bacterium]|nr:YidC/Oxa1 family rane protein insertase [Sphingomonadales bacterium]
MNDSKNLILAVVLSALVLLGWTWAANKYFPSANPPSTKIENGKQQPLPAQPQALPSAPATPKALQSVAAALAATPRVRIETPSLSGSINLKGAQIDDLLLVTQKQTIAKDSPPVRLLSPLGSPGAYIAQFGWTAQGGAAPDLNTVWSADSNVLTPGHPVTLTTQTPDGLRFAIKVAVDDGYLFTVQQAASNGSGKPVQLRPIGLVSRAGKSADVSTWTNHVGPISVFGGKADYDVNWKDLDEKGNQSFPGVAGWLGFTDKYWLTALVPPGSVTADFRNSASGGYQADYSAAPLNAAPGQTVTSQARLFAGAKQYELLKQYEAGGVDGLTRAIDWGYFRWFMLVIYDVLVFLFEHIGNFGVAII